MTRDEKLESTGSDKTLRRCLLEVEPHHVETVGLIGRAHITARAVRLCLDHGITVFWMKRNGRLLGRLVPELSRTADLRRRQFRLFENADSALALGRLFVDAKISNAAGLVAAVRSNRPGNRQFGKVITELELLRNQVSSADGRDRLLGIEGDAARRYFKVLGLAFSGPIRFSGRQRRPPPDPANALLSFGYELLSNLIASLLEARGFDPYLGMLHTVRSGRPSLALDVMEKFRHPVVDRFVLRACNRRQFTYDDFRQDELKGVRLTRNGLRRFLQQWEAYLDAPMAGIEGSQSIERVIQRQVDALAVHLREKETYRPIRIGRSVE